MNIEWNAPGDGYIYGTVNGERIASINSNPHGSFDARVMLDGVPPVATRGPKIELLQAWVRGVCDAFDALDIIENRRALAILDGSK